MNKRKYYVYILASKPFGAIYIGVTNDLTHRISQHREGTGSKHTAKYKIFRLVYWEEFQYVNDAIAREGKLKRWKRKWKDALIEEQNPDWHDLYDKFCNEGDW
jgi:putative endonuclease